MTRMLLLTVGVLGSLLSGCDTTGGWSNRDIGHPVLEGQSSGAIMDPYGGMASYNQTDYRMVTDHGKGGDQQVAVGAAMGPDGVYDYEESSVVFH